MRKYLELFINGFDETITDKVKVENKPYIGYSLTDGKVAYTVVPKPADPNTYVTFTAQQDNSSIGLFKLSTNQTLEYSTDVITWNTFDTTTSIPLNNGDKVYVRGILSGDNTSLDYTHFKMTGKIAASGNCNAIWNYEDLNAPLKAYCGYTMFTGCRSLISSPELPATTLAKSCYGCMFYECTSLTAAPALPATTLANNCYSEMFRGCTKLTITPELPATTLVEKCYYCMFYECTSLTTVSVLPATVLAEYCYDNMFRKCTKLNHITCLATDISATDCTNYWVYLVASTGTFVKHPDMNGWTTGRDGIPSGWTVVDAVL